MGGGDVLPPHSSLHSSSSSLWESDSEYPELAESEFRMDPLSVTASVIALVGLTAQVVKGINRLSVALRDGPAEILALNNEVADLQAILESAKEFARTTSPGQHVDKNQLESPRATPLLNIHLVTAREKLAELHDLLQRCLVKQNRAKLLAQWLRERKKATALQQDLRNVRTNLSTSLLLVTL